MEYDAQDGSLEPQPAVVFDEPQLLEFIHKKMDARAHCANHLRQHFAKTLCGVLRGFVVFTGQQQKSASKALLAVVEEPIDQVFLDKALAALNTPFVPFRVKAQFGNGDWGP
jgi:hypothetical protein